MTGNTRNLPCWIESFVDLTNGLMSPRIFRLWTAIGLMSALLERRVFTTSANSALYPNLFTMLVAPPGVGKTQALSRGRQFLLGAKDIKVAPNNMTKAALLDVLQASERRVVVDHTPTTFHGLQIISSEFGVFCPAHDLEFLSVLNDLYDCPTSYREHRRSQSIQIDIPSPQLSIIAGTQPGYLSNLLPAAAWDQGFMSRMIMVYSDEKIRVPLFDGTAEDKGLAKRLEEDVLRIAALKGFMSWSREAKDLMVTWYEGGCQPEPQHFKLKNYNARRHLHVLKLSMISCASRGDSREIAAEDVRRGIQWLTDAEALMPEIFKAMSGNEDYSVLQELQLYVSSQYLANDSKPLHEQYLVAFLQRRTPAGNILRLIEVAEKGGLVSRVPLTEAKLYKPGSGDLGPKT
jgi:hypothetical protein